MIQRNSSKFLYLVSFFVLYGIFLLSDSGGLEGGIPTEIGRLQNLLLLDLGMFNDHIYV